MGNQVDKKKFTSVIKNFSSLQSELISSDQFVVGGCKWHLLTFPERDKEANYLSLRLEVAEFQSLPSGWRRHAKVSFSISNQSCPHTLYKHLGFQHWFDEESTSWGFLSMFPLNELKATDRGFLVNDELKIVVEIEVLEVIGKLDVTEESSIIVESMDVNGFQVLPSKEECVRRVFERHPDIAVEFLAKNQLLRNACMNFLLSLIETLCQSLEELSNEDLVEADIALTYLKDASFKVDWLEKKLDLVKELKEKEMSELARLQETEKNLLYLKLKCLELDDLAEEQMAELTATRTPLSFDDIV